MELSAGMTQQRQKPRRYAPSIDAAEAAIRKHRALTSAALALGVSRGSLDRQVSRSSRLSWLVHQMRLEIVDLAEVQFAKKVQEGDTTCVLRALSSPIAKARGWGPSASAEGDEPRQIAEIVIKVIDAVDGRPVGHVIEHQAIENRAEDDAEPIDVTPEEAA